MKIFAVYSGLKLSKRPEWLDDFRKKYDDPYEYHIILKQPSYIKKEQQELDIKDKL